MKRLKRSCNGFLQCFKWKGYQSYVNKGKNAVNNIEQAPFDAGVLPSALNKIIIKEELFDEVAFIKEMIDVQREKGSLIEIPFVMFGFEDEHR